MDITRKRERPDWIFALLVIFMILFGIVMISSASSVISFEKFGNNYNYALRQIISFGIGLVVMFFTYLIDYRFWKKYSLWFFVGTLILNILVFVPPIGKHFGGAQRWIGFGSILFQPSEILKLFFIIYLASWFEKRAENVKKFLTGFLPFLVLLVIVGSLIMFQPDLGTSIIISGIAIVMYFAAGAQLSHLGLLLVTAVIAVFILIKAAPYRLQRFLVFLDPSSNMTAAYHINQALLAIGAGGVWGLGFGQSRQKYLYLPQAHTDSIFAIMAEELGFVRVLVFIGVYIFLIVRGFRIAKNAPDIFSKLLVIGVVSWIGLQAFINIGSMLGISPLTGVPLPFISYGGSSLIILMGAIGIVLNISKHVSMEGKR